MRSHLFRHFVDFFLFHAVEKRQEDYGISGFFRVVS